jgi:hypothetical protein
MFDAHYMQIFDPLRRQIRTFAWEAVGKILKFNHRKRCIALYNRVDYSEEQCSRKAAPRMHKGSDQNTTDRLDDFFGLISPR